MQASNAYQQATANASNTREVRDASGRVIGGDHQARQADLEAAKQAAKSASDRLRAYESRGARLRAEDQGRPDTARLQRELAIKPTYSNLPIAERLV
jgi:hypothetical protein